MSVVRDKPQQPGLDLVEMSAASVQEACHRWIAAQLDEVGANIADQRARRIARTFPPLAQKAGKPQRDLFKHRGLRDHALQHLILGHSSSPPVSTSDLFAAARRWAGLSGAPVSRRFAAAVAGAEAA